MVSGCGYEEPPLLHASDLGGGWHQERVLLGAESIPMIIGEDCSDLMHLLARESEPDAVIGFKNATTGSYLLQRVWQHDGRGFPYLLARSASGCTKFDIDYGNYVVRYVLTPEHTEVSQGVAVRLVATETQSGQVIADLVIFASKLEHSNVMLRLLNNQELRQQEIVSVDSSFMRFTAER